MSGTRVSGSGTTAVVTKGALTNWLTSTQANGNFLAFLRKSGFDAVIEKDDFPKFCLANKALLQLYFCGILWSLACRVNVIIKGDLKR